MTRKLFGTDGIRARANTAPMTASEVVRMGQAIGIAFRAKQHRTKIVIGKDTRRSGYMIEQALSAGVCSVGVDTCLVGPVPTPGIAYLTKGMRANAGIVISASHNPFYDNGIKIFSANGFKLDDSIELNLEELMAGDDLERHYASGERIGTTRRIDDAIGQYAVFLKEQFPKHLSLDGIRIVVDAGHGAAYRLAPRVFEDLGAEVFVRGATPNGVNINAGVGALHPEGVAEDVRRFKADIGIALDGDADRLVAVDEHGDQLDGDEIMAIYGRYAKERGRLAANKVVSTVMSNLGLEQSLASAGITLVRTQVGDRYVVEAMRQHKANLGGEQSGHLIFLDNSTTGDGTLAGLSLIEVMLETAKPLSELRRCMAKLPQVTHSFEVAAKPELESLVLTQELLRQVNDELTGAGRVLLRYSGTESKARIMLEGPDVHHIERRASDIAVCMSAEIQGALQ